MKKVHLADYGLPQDRIRAMEPRTGTTVCGLYPEIVVDTEELSVGRVTCEDCIRIDGKRYQAFLERLFRAQSTDDPQQASLFQ